MSTTVPKGDFIVVLKRALKDAETRELVAEELSLYDDTNNRSSTSSIHVSNTKQKSKATNSSSNAEMSSLEQRVKDLEKIFTKQGAKLKAQEDDLARLWGLLGGEKAGPQGVLTTVTSSPKFRNHSTDEDESGDGDEPPALIKPRGRGRIQTARRSRPFYLRGGRGRAG